MNSNHKPSFLYLFLIMVLKTLNHNSQRKNSVFYISMPFIPYIILIYILMQMIDIILSYIS